MTAFEEKHNTSIADLTKNTNNDKNEFMKKMQENRSNELFDMKREFGRMMDATVQDYEQRISKYQRENEYLKMSMDQKVQNIIERY